MKIKNIYIITIVIFVFALACKEQWVHRPESDDKTPPKPPTNISYEALYGGARFFYTVPDDEDLLSVDASFQASNGEEITASASYFLDSLDVMGLGDTLNHSISIYAVDRAGNKSVPVVIDVKPLEPAISRVAKSIRVKPGFSSFFLDWVNELEQNIHVTVDFSYTKEGKTYDYTSVFTSNLPEERRFIENLYLKPEELVAIDITVSDSYGNETEKYEMGEISLLEDTKIPKEGWVLPATNDSIGGVPQCYGDALEGRLQYVIDDIIDRGDNLNFMHTRGRGRTGIAKDGNMPWNIIIDLGDYYELSRIVTVQRHTGGLDNVKRGQYYKKENVGLYEMYIWDDDLDDWVFVSEHKIPVPVGLSELEFVKKGEAGDMAYMYPDEPVYTKPTRWFRYKAVKGFTSNHTIEDANCLSEITLYGRKAN